MKTFTAIAIAAAVVMTAALPAKAANSNKGHKVAVAQHEASCKAEAAKKFSGIHFIKRRNFVNNCMGRTTHAAKAMTIHHTEAVKTAKKATPTTTGQSVK